MRKSSSTMTLLKKLQSLIFVREDGCWMFLGPWNSHGYGHLSYDAHVYRAHRVSWELHKGPIPDNLNVLHKCDNRWCVNPEHLFLGTLKDNADDMRAKGRDSYGDNFGENNGQAKLTEDEVRQIRQLLSSGQYTQTAIGDMFGVGRGAVKQIKSGRTWRYLQ